MSFRYKNVVDIVNYSLNIMGVAGEYITDDNIDLLTNTKPTTRMYATMLRSGVQFILETVNTPEVLGLRRSLNVPNRNAGVVDADGIYPIPIEAQGLLQVCSGNRYFGLSYTSKDGYSSSKDVYTYGIGDTAEIIIDAANNPPDSLTMDYITANVYRVIDDNGGYTNTTDFNSTKDIVLIDWNLVSKAFMREYAKEKDAASLASYDGEYKYALMQVMSSNSTPGTRIDVRGCW